MHFWVRTGGARFRAARDDGRSVRGGHVNLEGLVFALDPVRRACLDSVVVAWGAPSPTRCYSMTLRAGRAVRERSSNDFGRGATSSTTPYAMTCYDIVAAGRLSVAPRWGRHGGTRGRAATGNRRSHAHAFDDTVDSHHQSTSGVTCGYGACTTAATLVPGDALRLRGRGAARPALGGAPTSRHVRPDLPS